MQKKVAFVIQGEGRGHLTQAIALQTLLLQHHQCIVAVLVGTSHRRRLPDFFTQQMRAPIHLFASPNFVTDKKGKGIEIGKSIIYNVKRWKQYKDSLQLLAVYFEQYKPDVVINFYEPLMGCYVKWYRPNFTTIAIAHQYLFLHKRFQFPEGKWLDRYLLRFFTNWTARGNQHKLALSFYSLPNDKRANITVIPPLLREAVYKIQPKTKPYLLVYLVNCGYMEELCRWSNAHPEVQLHCFTDSKAVKGEWQYSVQLCFHSINDQLFLQMMANASGVVCTAGFESVCEAIYLQKPVMLVPVKGHYEQFCNAFDALQINAGISHHQFDISRFIHYLPEHEVNPETTHWMQQTDRYFWKAWHKIVMETPSRNFPLPFSNIETALSNG